MARAPATATGGASAATGLVEASPNSCASSGRRVGLAAHAAENGLRSQRGGDFVLRPQARRTGRRFPTAPTSRRLKRPSPRRKPLKKPRSHSGRRAGGRYCRGREHGARPGDGPSDPSRGGEKTPGRGRGRAAAGHNHEASAGGHFLYCRSQLGAARRLCFLPASFCCSDRPPGSASAVPECQGPRHRANHEALKTDRLAGECPLHGTLRTHQLHLRRRDGGNPQRPSSVAGIAGERLLSVYAA